MTETHEEHFPHEADMGVGGIGTTLLGTDGVCERCGEPILLARLRALPTARNHVQYMTEEEAGPPLMTEEERTLAVGEAETLIAAGMEEIIESDQENRAYERPAGPVQKKI